VKPAFPGLFISLSIRTGCSGWGEADSQERLVLSILSEFHDSLSSVVTGVSPVCAKSAADTAATTARAHSSSLHYHPVNGLLADKASALMEF